MHKKIYVVEDEPDILELVTINLQRAGFKVEYFETASSFLKKLEAKKPDLIILDLMLPDADGFDICKHLKSEEDARKIPIIMLTAKGDEVDRILGLELGADDYVTKPFSVKELVARVKAVLRRSEKEEEKSGINIGEGSLTLDLEKHEVQSHGKKINLTSTEFKILTLLASKKGWVFSREKILDYLWGSEKIVVDRTIDVHIKHLREKLGDAAVFIKNIRGIGYKFEE